MTYCLAAQVNDGLVFASDSRTNAGVDYVSTYSKMHSFALPNDRFITLLSSGNLATTQAVINIVVRDLADAASQNLGSFRYLFEVAQYVGELSQRVQERHGAALREAGISPEANFIVGGQIRGQPPGLYLVYPQGNYIAASPEMPYLQIGETKYGKPILDRIVRPTTTLDDAARCALVSIDSTMRANISVGPPIELIVYAVDRFELTHRLHLGTGDALLMELQKRWNEGLRQAFLQLPRFEWE
jgi:putative proteasome-type protease